MKNPVRGTAVMPAVKRPPRNKRTGEIGQNLRIGDRGVSVSRLQKLLNTHSNSLLPPAEPLETDGIFGPKTRDAVLRFQRYKSISMDGIVGRITWSQLLTRDFSGSVATGGQTALAAVSQTEDIAAWPLEDKFEVVLRSTLPKLPLGMRNEFAKLLTPTAIGSTAAVFVVLAISHFFGVGEIIDVLLLLVGAAFLGLAVVDVASHLKDFLVTTVEASSQSDLNKAAEHLAYAISIMGVAAFLALLRKARAKGGGAPNGKSTPQSAPPKSASANQPSRRVPKESVESTAQQAKKPVVQNSISTGRTTPKNLKEKLAMEQVKSNPGGKKLPVKMSDSKNNLLAEDGWVKKAQNVNGVEIHYVENTKTGQIVDFKFKD